MLCWRTWQRPANSASVSQQKQKDLHPLSISEEGDEPDSHYGSQLHQNKGYLPNTDGFSSADSIPISIDNTTPSNNNELKIPVQEGSTVSSVKKQVQLQVELKSLTSTIYVETSTVSRDQTGQAQQIIASAVNKDETAQNNAINRAIAVLYPYPLQDGQREALHQLIYC
jgi:hypothetical protein